MTTKYQIIYWRDIPAQVKVKAGRERRGKPLSKRFSVAIDEAAMCAGLTESSNYLAQWRTSEWQARNGAVADIVAVVAAELEAAYPADRLRTLVKQFGQEVETE